MRTFRQDLRYAFRSFRKSPAVSVIAVLSLALGIGAASTAFGLIEAIRLRALPYPDAERLVALGERSARGPSAGRSSARFATYLRWQEGLRTLRPLAARALTGGYLAPEGGIDGAGVGGEAVTPNLFDLLSVRPAIGRPLAASDDRPGAAPVLLMGHGVWRDHFGSDPAIVGRTVKLSGVAYTVIGVMPPGFRYEFQSEFWIPLVPYLTAREARRLSPVETGESSVSVLGRLAPGTNLAQARAELAAFPSQPSADGRRWTAHARPMRQEMLTFWRSYDLAFGAVALAVLLIACSNLSGLLLVRSIGRQREFAVRSALGASPARIARQLLTEGLLLAIVGGALGAVLSAWAVGALRGFRVTLGLLPSSLEAGLGSRSLPIAAGLTLVTAVLVSLAPALRMARGSPQRFLRGSALGQSGTRARRTQHAFVALQIAGAIILASLAGIGARAYQRFETADVGFDYARVVTANFETAPAPGQTALEAFAPVRERLLAIPGVAAVGVQFRDVTGARFTSNEPAVLTVARRGGIAEIPRPGVFAVDAAFFQALAIPILRGRAFDDGRDAFDNVAIVNALAAAAWWPGEEALGQRFRLGGPSDPGPWTTVVGVAGDAREVDPVAIVEPPRPTVYAHATRGAAATFEIFARAEGTTAEALVRPVSSVLRELNPDRRTLVLTQRELYRYVLDPMRANVVGILGAALCGLFLAAIGIYGVLAWAVERRRQEIGLRMALGAGRVSLVGMLLREGLVLAIAGLAAGFGAALAVLRLAQGVFFGGLEADPATLAGVGAAFLAVTVLASAVPVRRALRVDPIVTLRGE